MENYNQMKERHNKEFSSFEGIFFAFNTEQFREGMEKVGLAENETDKIFKIDGGGFLRKDRAQGLDDIFTRFAKERKERLSKQKALVEALAYELANHECCITGDESEALEALGLKVEDIDKNILNKAIKKAYKKG